MCHAEFLRGQVLTQLLGSFMMNVQIKFIYIEKVDSKNICLNF